MEVETDAHHIVVRDMPLDDLAGHGAAGTEEAVSEVPRKTCPQCHVEKSRHEFRASDKGQEGRYRTICVTCYMDNWLRRMNQCPHSTFAVEQLPNGKRNVTITRKRVAVNEHK